MPFLSTHLAEDALLEVAAPATAAAKTATAIATTATTIATAATVATTIATAEVLAATVASLGRHVHRWLLLSSIAQLHALLVANELSE